MTSPSLAFVICRDVADFDSPLSREPLLTARSRPCQYRLLRVPGHIRRVTDLSNAFDTSVLRGPRVRAGCHGAGNAKYRITNRYTARLAADAGPSDGTVTRFTNPFRTGVTPH